MLTDGSDETQEAPSEGSPTGEMARIDSDSSPFQKGAD